MATGGHYCTISKIEAARDRSSALSDHGTRRDATCTDSVAAAISNGAPEMLRTIARTVLFDQTAASTPVMLAPSRQRAPRSP